MRHSFSTRDLSGAVVPRSVTVSVEGNFQSSLAGQYIAAYLFGDLRVRITAQVTDTLVFHSRAASAFL